MVAEPQVGYAGIGDTRLPCHLERSELGQVAQDLEPTVGKLSTGVLVQFEMLQLRRPRQMLQAVVGKLPRAAQTEPGDMIELRNALQNGVRHQPVCLERRDTPLFHHVDQEVPFAGGYISPRYDFVFLGVNGVRSTRWRSAR